MTSTNSPATAGQHTGLRGLIRDLRLGMAALRRIAAMDKCPGCGRPQRQRRGRTA